MGRETLIENDWRLTTGLRRLEVHAIPPSESDREPGITWSMWIRPTETGMDVWGYLRRKGEEGFGQAQSSAKVLKRNWSQSHNSLSTRKEMATWVERYVAEDLYDVARRALQAQAALMDFLFDIEPNAPHVEPSFFGDEVTPTVD